MSERRLLVCEMRYSRKSGVEEAVAELQPGDIVVTHHTSCFASIYQTYQKAPTNCFYSPMT